MTNDKRSNATLEAKGTRIEYDWFAISLKELGIGYHSCLGGGGGLASIIILRSCYIGELFKSIRENC